jgi:hypothetical protein
MNFIASVLAPCLLSQCGKEQISANKLEQKKTQKDEHQSALKTPLETSTPFSEQNAKPLSYFHF